MNCRPFEPLIALHAGADLGGRDAARVEQHLAVCPDCRQLLEELQASQAALRELGSETVDAALLSAMHAGVMAGLGDRRRVVWPWVAALAGAAALVGGLLVGWPIAAPRKPVEQPRPALKQVAIARPAVAEPPAPVPRRVVKWRAPKPKRGEPLVVKMLTDDPDIVIIWLVDQRGD